MKRRFHGISIALAAPPRQNRARLPGAGRLATLSRRRATDASCPLQPGCGMKGAGIQEAVHELARHFSHCGDTL